ncbi:MAG TPA: hypothetical protein EYH34_04965 [Planctomycetes bacterium]|nr:hypothetical protein [Planctomycetota bacterium]
MPTAIQLPEAVQSVLEILTSTPIRYALIAAAVLASLYVFWRLVRRRRALVVDLREPEIDVNQLGEAGPPETGPRLEYYHVPVRLAAIILAPAGRGQRLPPPEQRGELLEAIVPGLASVVQSHETLVQHWPPQLSIHGFTRTVFARIRLPGEAGKGTPWCVTAGVFRFQGQITLAGLVMRAAGVVYFGRREIEDETKWLDVLRVRSPQPP